MNHIPLLSEESYLTPYLLEGRHPAILVIPGGGYGCVCERSEGEPVARRFNELGFHAFVLQYRVAPHRFPEPQQDAIRAMRLIRHNAEAWGVIPDRIAACGGSAGGHLTACLGTITDMIPDAVGDEIDSIDPIPDALILSYAVTSMGKVSSHPGSAVNLLGPELPEDLMDLCTLSNQVGPDTPPAFVWHTFTDTTVNYRNALEFADAMAKTKRPCELHIFPHGNHGMLLGLGTEDVGKWTSLAASFITQEWEMRDGREAEILEKYDYGRQLRLENQYRKEPIEV